MDLFFEIFNCFEITFGHVLVAVAAFYTVVFIWISIQSYRWSQRVAKEYDEEQLRKHTFSLKSEKRQVNKILSYSMPEVVQKYYPGSWLNHDKDGRPVYMLMVGLMDLKGFVRSIGQEGLMELTRHVCDQALKKAKEATNKFSKPITQWTLLLDLDGLNEGHQWWPGITVVLRIIEMVEANYPETLGRVIMTRAPKLFPIIYTMLSPFINENTYRKLVLLGDKQELLKQFMAIEDIPKMLGGKLDNAPQLLTGGLIPKSQYINDELNLLDNTMYKNVSLAKGEEHKILYDIEDSQSVICWDFDVLKQDICFNFIRLSPERRSSNQESNNDDTSCGMIIPNNLEPDLIAREGDSIQVGICIHRMD